VGTPKNRGSEGRGDPDNLENVINGLRPQTDHGRGKIGGEKPKRVGIRDGRVGKWDTDTGPFHQNPPGAFQGCRSRQCTTRVWEVTTGCRGGVGSVSNKGKIKPRAGFAKTNEKGGG